MENNYKLYSELIIIIISYFDDPLKNSKIFFLKNVQDKRV